jgi:hypothetical protein
LNKNSWFKHYNNASQGQTLSVLWANSDTEAIALFWLLLEMVSRWEDESTRGEIEISWALLARETNWKPTKCKRVMTRILSVSKIEMNEKQTGNVAFLVPNWMKLQGTWGGKRESRFEQDSTDLRLKTEDLRLKTEDVENRKREIQKLLADAGWGKRDVEKTRDNHGEPIS